MTQQEASASPDLALTLTQAAHHRAAMTDRRALGLKIVVGIVGFDLAVLKLGIDAASHVRNANELAWSVRIVAVAAFVVIVGMLTQIELRSRRDRQIYIGAERRAEAIRSGNDPAEIAQPMESLLVTFRNSWATTWPLLGVLVLTAAICVLAGSLR